VGSLDAEAEVTILSLPLVGGECVLAAVPSAPAIFFFNFSTSQVGIFLKNKHSEGPKCNFKKIGALPFKFLKILYQSTGAKPPPLSTFLTSKIFSFSILS
jgi:hypothetical protein